MKHALFIYFWLIVAVTKAQSLNELDIFYQLNTRLTETIIQDGFSPPVASRIYMYTNLFAYEVAVQGEAGYKSMAGQLKDYKGIPFIPNNVDKRIVLVTGFKLVATKMVYRDYLMEQLEQELIQKIRPTIGDVKTELSITFAKSVYEGFAKWMDGDNYDRSRSFARHFVSSEPGRWLPTPPNYGEAVEPHWRTIRTLVLDSAAQFKPAPPLPFSTDPNSQFYRQAKAVYEEVKASDKSKQEIAKFWDCNPISPTRIGHLMFMQRQLTPGGHWMNIAQIVCKKQKKNFVQTAEACFLTALGLFESFIACWDEKYRSDLIRPESYISQHIDPAFKPLLITPEFPEHPSGHATISMTSSVILTHLFGDNVSFEDDSEVSFGLPVRTFQSFKVAAEEAALSRFYGGIHYQHACDEGKKLGEKVGKLILKKIKTRT